MNAVIRNIFHQRAIDRLLFFNPTHAGKQLTHGNNLKVAAIAGNVDFLEGESVHQHALNFIIFHGIFNHQLINQRNILEQSCAGINKQKASLINQTRLDLQAGLPDRRLTPYPA